LVTAGPCSSSEVTAAASSTRTSAGTRSYGRGSVTKSPFEKNGPADKGVSPVPDAAQSLGELEGAFGFGAGSEELAGLPAQRDVDRDQLARDSR